MVHPARRPSRTAAATPAAAPLRATQPRAALVATAVLFGVLSGCSAGQAASSSPAGNEATSTRPASSASSAASSPAAVPVTAEPTATAPANGAVLGVADEDGRVNVLSGGSGFSVVDSKQDASQEDYSIVAVYDAAGNAMSTIPVGSLTGECGAADVVAADGTRVILTELVTHTPGAGVIAAKTSRTVTAWDAQTGHALWRLRIDSPADDSDSYDALCEANDGRNQEITAVSGSSYVIVRATTTHKKWVVNLLDGKARRDDAALDIVSKWILDAAGSGTVLSDPATGRKLATSPYTVALGGARSGIFSNGAGTENKSGLSSDGKLVFTEDGRALTLPRLQLAWRFHGNQPVYLLGAAGGVLVVGMEDSLRGFAESTGKPLWKLPSSTVCGITAHQMLVEAADQVAVIDVATGKQLSYETGQCSRMLPSGIGVGPTDDASSFAQQVTQRLQP
jgi:hypothetical protein